MTIGNRIKELRTSKGYTQELIAERLGISRQAVCKWEQDQTTPDTNNLIQLSELLDTTIEYLATGKIVDAEQQLQQLLMEQEMLKKYKLSKKILLAALICLLAMFLIPGLMPLFLIITIVLGVLGIWYQRKAIEIDNEISKQK